MIILKNTIICTSLLLLCASNTTFAQQSQSVKAVDSCWAVKAGRNYVRVSWTPANADNADRYTIKRSRNGGTNQWMRTESKQARSSIVTESSTGNLQYRVETISASDVKVSRQCGPGGGFDHDGKSTLVAVAACWASKQADGSTSITWTPRPNDDADRYTVMQSKNRGDYQWADTVQRDKRKSNFTPDSSGTYRYQVRTVAWNGEFVVRDCGPDSGVKGVTSNELAPLEPETGALFGAWPGSGATGRYSSEAAVSAFESLTNSRIDIVQTFHPPHDPNFKLDWANWVLETDRIPLITWKVGPGMWPNAGDNIAQQVVNGTYDNQIRERAAEAKQIDGLWFSRLFHEMDGAYGRRYDMTPDLFHAYWKRVRRIFAEEGVTNAVWVWTPAVLQPGEEKWYPGDTHVDWIGVDPYLWIGDDADLSRCFTDAYRSLEDAIGKTFWNFAAQHPSKPIMLAEWGVGHRANTTIRERFFASANDAIAKHPKLKALVYFNSNPSNQCGWSLEASKTPQAMTAYKNLVNNN